MKTNGKKHRVKQIKNNPFLIKIKNERIEVEVYFLIIYTFIFFLKNKTINNAPEYFLKNETTHRYIRRFEIRYAVIIKNCFFRTPCKGLRNEGHKVAE